MSCWEPTSKLQQLSRSVETTPACRMESTGGSAQRNLVLAKPGGDQRHASVMAAMTDVRGMADMMDVVTMSVLLVHRMSHRQADGFCYGRGGSRF